MSVAIPLVRAGVLHALCAFLQRQGAPVEALMARVKLSPRALEDTEILVPFAAVIRFLEAAAHAEGAEDLGLRIGQATQIQHLGNFGRVILQSLTLGEVIQTAHRVWASYNSGVRVSMSRSAQLVHLHHEFQGDELQSPQYASLALMQYLHVLRSVAGGWRPSALQLPMRRLPGLRDIPILSNTRIEFGMPAIRISFPAVMLHEPVRRVPALRAPAVNPAWEESGPATDLGGAVRQIVTTLLPDGRPDLHVVSEVASMSSRTLQRRLRDEGLTFARVVAQARFDAARRLLDDPQRKVIDVALDLGYSDPAHFTRAFERWTGLGPREFRRRRAAGTPALPEADRRQTATR